MRFFVSSLVVSLGISFSASAQTVPASAPVKPVAAPTPAPKPTPTIPKARESTELNMTVCGGDDTLQGTDVTDYARGTDWGSVHDSGTGFVFIKATEGETFRNKLFVADWQKSKKAGLKRGAYHFFRPGDDGEEQAKFFLKTIGKLDDDDLAAVLDWETTDDVDNDTQIDRALTFLKTVEAATGKVPIIYVSPAFFNALGNPKAFVRYPLFIADWDAACPSVPPPWSKWAFWQNTKSGSISGLINDADVDVFGGTLKDLRELMRVWR